MDKYARLMQKLEVVNVEFFKVSHFFLKWASCKLPTLYLFSLYVTDTSLRLFFSSKLFFTHSVY